MNKEITLSESTLLALVKERGPIKRMKYAKSLINEKAGYNGHKNYETWLISLWFDNEEGTQATCQVMAKAAYAEAEADKHNTRAQSAVYAFSKKLTEYADEMTEAIIGTGASFVHDLVSAGLRSVDWYEVAQGYIDEVELECDECAAKIKQGYEFEKSGYGGKMQTVCKSCHDED